MTATTSGIVNSRFIGLPNAYEAKIKTGATNSAICRLDPSAMPRDKSILFRIAIKIADECSAALPIIATTITPTKTSVKPSAPLRLRRREIRKSRRRTPSLSRASESNALSTNARPLLLLRDRLFAPRRFWLRQ